MALESSVTPEHNKLLFPPQSKRFLIPPLDNESVDLIFSEINVAGSWTFFMFQRVSGDSHCIPKTRSDEINLSPSLLRNACSKTFFSIMACRA
jgi:hypothetical protein